MDYSWVSEDCVWFILYRDCYSIYNSWCNYFTMNYLWTIWYELYKPYKASETKVLKKSIQNISKLNFYKKAFRSPTFLSYNNHNFTYQMMSAMSAHCTTTVRREISNMFDTIERSNWQIPGTGTLNKCGYGNFYQDYISFRRWKLYMA